MAGLLSQPFAIQGAVLDGLCDVRGPDVPALGQIRNGAGQLQYPGSGFRMCNSRFKVLRAGCPHLFAESQDGHNPYRAVKGKGSFGWRLQIYRWARQSKKTRVRPPNIHDLSTSDSMGVLNLSLSHMLTRVSGRMPHARVWALLFVHIPGAQTKRRKVGQSVRDRRSHV